MESEKNYDRNEFRRDDSEEAHPFISAPLMRARSELRKSDGEYEELKKAFEEMLKQATEVLRGVFSQEISDATPIPDLEPSIVELALETLLRDGVIKGSNAQHFQYLDRLRKHFDFGVAKGEPGDGSHEFIFNKEQFGHSHNEIVPLPYLDILQQVAPKYGVNIRILQKEGEQYTNSYKGFTQTRIIEGRTGEDRYANVQIPAGQYSGPVPAGSAYIEISSPNKDLGDFYSDVKAKESKQNAT